MTSGAIHPLSRSALWRFALAASVCVGGCAAPADVVDPVEQLEQARLALAAQRPESALELLLAIDADAVPRSAQARFDYSLALAYAQVGDASRAFARLATFADDHPMSEVRTEVQALLFSIGSTYARSDRYVWLFLDDRAWGKAVLEHLVTHYPNTPDRDDALHLIGDIAYENGDFEESTLRYQELIRDYLDSEWADLARFRVAMSQFKQLRGPGYDLSAMRIARSELQTLVDNPPGRVELAREALETRDLVDEWIAAHHLITADYYRTLNNPTGERIYLERACEAPHDQTPAAETARARIGAMDREAAGDGLAGESPDGL